MINFANKTAQDRILDLGCGSNRHPQADVAIDVRKVDGVDFPADFTKPFTAEYGQAVSSDEFTVVLCRFCLEHLPFAVVPQFLREVFRITKPGGRAILAIPNTEAQFKWIISHKDGWDGKDFFNSASEKLFGSQNMPDESGVDQNTHRCYFDPDTAIKLFRDAGFVDVLVTPYGERATDMVVEARKPAEVVGINMDPSAKGQLVKKPLSELVKESEARKDVMSEEERLILFGNPEAPKPGGVLTTKGGKAVEELSSPPPTTDDPEDWGGLLDRARREANEKGILPGGKGWDDLDAFKEARKAKTKPVEIAWDGLCTCNCASTCPLGKTGSQFRCSEKELLDNKIPTVRRGTNVSQYTGDNPENSPPTASEPEPAPTPTAVVQDTSTEASGAAPAVPATPPAYDPGKVFTKLYFDGGRGGFGGYGGLGAYRDFPAHVTTANHILARRPESVLELGCGRGYVLKRIQDAGVSAQGVEISRHCKLTAACDPIWSLDITKTPWPCNVDAGGFDLCFGITVLEHIPEPFLPAVVREAARTCKRGLFGITTHPTDAGDQTRVTVRNLDWWRGLFAAHAPGWPVEILERDALEAGPLPPEVVMGDGRTKLNLGCFTNQFHHGWINIDQHDLNQWAQSQGYRYLRHDLRNGLPFNTGGVDLIFMHHFLEHLTYEEGRRLLSDCRRCLKVGGVMRIVVPDASFLIERYQPEPTEYDERNEAVGWNSNRLSEFHEISDGAENAPTAAGKLWELLVGGDHKAIYDEETLVGMVREAGFDAERTSFRCCGAPMGKNDWKNAVNQILQETTEMSFGGLSLFVDAVPKMG